MFIYNVMKIFLQSSMLFHILNAVSLSLHAQNQRFHFLEMCYSLTLQIQKKENTVKKKNQGF